MDELIKRQDALDALCDACTLASVKSECIFKNLESCMDHNAILDVPTIEERKKGKWIRGKCDQCGAHAPFWPMASTYYESDYCPNCGAEMRGEGHE